MYGSRCFWPLSAITQPHAPDFGPRSQLKIFGFSPLLAFSYRSASKKCEKLLNRPPDSFNFVPSHFAHASPAARFLAFTVALGAGSTPVPLHRSQGFGKRPGTGDARRRTKQHASHTCALPGVLKVFWSVSDSVTKTEIGTPRNDAAPQIAQGSSSWSTLRSSPVSHPVSARTRATIERHALSRLVVM